MKMLRIYSLNHFPIYHTSVLAIIMLYIISPVLIYLIIGILYLLTIFLYSPFPPSFVYNFFFYDFFPLKRTYYRILFGRKYALLYTRRRCYWSILFF